MTHALIDLIERKYKLNGHKSVNDYNKNIELIGALYIHAERLEKMCASLAEALCFLRSIRPDCKCKACKTLTEYAELKRELKGESK